MQIDDFVEEKVKDALYRYKQEMQRKGVPADVEGFEKYIRRTLKEVAQKQLDTDVAIVRSCGWHFTEKWVRKMLRVFNPYI